MSRRGRRVSIAVQRSITGALPRYLPFLGGTARALQTDTAPVWDSIGSALLAVKSMAPVLRTPLGVWSDDSARYTTGGMLQDVGVHT